MRRAFPRALLAAVFLFATASSSPAEPLVAARGGERWVLLAGRDGARLELPGGGTLPLSLPAGSAVTALAALDGGWVAAGTVREAGGRGLLLLAGDAEEARTLPEPPGQRGRERAWPVLFVEDGRLAGAAWLEGDEARTFAVYAAAWDGRAWGPVEVVARRGPGSQLALAGAVLRDGSWLLLWSAFDGHDDEIVWTLRDGGGWRPAERLSADNAVPDVVPAVVATRDGALAAWSRYDGEGYRLRLARFAAGTWRGERAVAPTGSLYPSFGGEPGRPTLLYLSVIPRGWIVAELDAKGGIKRRSAVAAAPATLKTPASPATPESTGLDRPVVLPGPAGGLVLRWSEPGRETPLSWERTP